MDGENGFNVSPLRALPFCPCDFDDSHFCVTVRCEFAVRYNKVNKVVILSSSETSLVMRHCPTHSIETAQCSLSHRTLEWSFVPALDSRTAMSRCTIPRDVDFEIPVHSKILLPYNKVNKKLSKPNYNNYLHLRMIFPRSRLLAVIKETLFAHPSGNRLPLHRDCATGCLTTTMTHPTKKEEQMSLISCAT